MLQKRPMEFYDPEPLIEQYSEPFPFDVDNDPSYFQIKIEGKGIRVKSLVNRSLKNFGSGKKIVFIAQGRDITKAVSCVEIMKTYYKKPIYQLTRINQIRTIETWYPRVEGLDPIRVTRAVPAIYIMISQEKLPEDEEGYQVYNHRDPKKVLNQQAVEAAEASDSYEDKQDVTENSSNSDDLTESPGCDQKENIPSTESESTDDNNCTSPINILNNEP